MDCSGWVCVCVGGGGVGGVASPTENSTPNQAPDACCVLSLQEQQAEKGDNIKG